jgi:hypothetical protein
VSEIERAIRAIRNEAERNVLETLQRELKAVIIEGPPEFAQGFDACRKRIEDFVRQTW